MSEPDRGQTHAVNKGLERATGELCAWLNADDAYNPEAVDRAVALLAERPDVDVLYGGIQFTDEDLVVRRTYIPAAPSFHRYLFFGDYIPTPTFIFRRSLLAGSGLLDERWVDAADYDFYLRLMHGRRVHRFPEPLVRFRYHAGSKTGTRRHEGAGRGDADPAAVGAQRAATGRSCAASTRSSAPCCRGSQAGPSRTAGCAPTSRRPRGCSG